MAAYSMSTSRRMNNIIEKFERIARDNPDKKDYMLSYIYNGLPALREMDSLRRGIQRRVESADNQAEMLDLLDQAADVFQRDAGYIGVDDLVEKYEYVHTNFRYGVSSDVEYQIKEILGLTSLGDILRLAERAGELNGDQKRLINDILQQKKDIIDAKKVEEDRTGVYVM